MSRCHVNLDGSTVTIERGIPEPSGVTMVECKGWGHPDTLADHLAEQLSRAYGRYTRSEFGAVLHHNFDKLAVLGGASEVRYGGGRIVSPVRVLVNGRAARSYAGLPVPVNDLIVHEVEEFFGERLPELRGHLSIEVNVTSNASPGADHSATHGRPRRRGDRADWHRQDSGVFNSVD